MGFSSVFLAAAIAALAAPAQLEQPNPAVVPVSRSDFGWWLARHKAILEKTRQGGIELIFLGDSITAGWNDKRLRKYWPAWKTANLGIPADRTEHVLWRITNGEIDGLKPKLVVLMIGTNNLKSGHVRMRPEQVSAAIARVLDVLLKRLPETRILLCGILPRNSLHKIVFDAVQDTNLLLPALSDRPRVCYTDFGYRYLDEAGNVRGDLMPDSLHPNAKGFEIWADSIRHMVHVLMGPASVGARYDGTGYRPANPPIRWCKAWNMRFAVELPGEGRGTPVVFDNRAFLVCSPASLVCLNAANGSVLWHKSTERQPAGKHRNPSLSPLVTLDRIYAVLPNNDVVCCEHDGTLVWRRELTQPAVRPVSSPVLAGNVLVVQQDKLTGLDPAKGKVLWQRPLGEAVTRHTPAALGNGADAVIASPCGGAFRARDGAALEAALPATTACALVSEQTNLYTCAGDKDPTVSRFTLSADGRTLERRWSKPWPAPVTTFAAPLIQAGRLFAMSAGGLIRVFDAASGDLLHERRLPAKALESGEPAPHRAGSGAGPSPHPAPSPALVATPKYVYARTFSNPAITAVFSNNAEFKEVWRFSVRDAAPCDAFEEDAHFVRAGTRLVCMAGKDPAEPARPPCLHEPEPVADPGRYKDLPVVKYHDDTSITNWVHARIADGAGSAEAPKMTPVPVKAIWKHDIQTTGRPAIDLSVLYERKARITARLQTIMENDRERTVRFSYLTPRGDTWHWKDRLDVDVTIGDSKNIDRRDVIKLRKGRYLLQLDIRRGRLGGSRKAWLGPHFVEGDYQAELDAGTTAYEKSLKTWQEYSRTRDDLPGLP